MDSRNYLRAVFFERPEHIPVHFAINGACWHHYPREAIWQLLEEHKLLFPDFKHPAADWQPSYPPDSIAGKPYTDPMGCVWETTDDGIRGTVNGHPLADWSSFGTTWKIADPDTTDGVYPVNWVKREEEWKRMRDSGTPFVTGLRHGHTFLQLSDLRGYEALLCDMADEEPLLDELIGQLTEFNLTLVRRFVKSGCAMIEYPEDLGVQVGPMISPALFRRYIKPAYKRLMQPAKDAGIAIQMHSDGDIRVLADDLIDSGVQCINLQDLVNGVDWIAERYRGKVCVDLDIDRQKITPYGTPEQIDALIREEIEKLATPEGGLALTYGWYPGVPLENIRALMDALEKYAFA